MESMTGSADEPRRAPAPPYRRPAAPGQSYPPLGFGPDGLPRFSYQAPSPAAELPPEPVEPEAPQPEGFRPPDRRAQESRQNLIVGSIGLLVAVLLVIGAFKLFTGGDDEPVQVRSDPPLSQPLDDPYLDEGEAPRHENDDEPTTPRQSPPTDAPADGRITYVATSTGDGVIRFQQGRRTLVGVLQAGTWRRSFTDDGSGPLAMELVVTPGASATCRILRGDQVIANEELSPETPDRTLTCRG